MKSRWYVNVVWYDGVSAYVSKFILPADDQGKIALDEFVRVQEYLKGNGELLKIDPSYPLTVEELKAINEHGDDEQKRAFDRYLEMYL